MPAAPGPGFQIAPDWPILCGMSNAQETERPSNRSMDQHVVSITKAALKYDGRTILIVIALGLAIWALAATYVAISDIAIDAITDAGLLKAAAVFGAFVLFGCLVAINERLRSRERQLDAAFARLRGEET